MGSEKSIATPCLQGNLEISGIQQSNGAVTLSCGRFVVADVNPGLASMGFDPLEVASRIVAAWNAAQSATASPDDKLGRHLEAEHHAIRATEIDSPMNACSLKETCQWIKHKFLTLRLATPSATRTISRDQAENLARWLVGYLGPLERDELTEPAVGYILGQVGVGVTVEPGKCPRCGSTETATCRRENCFYQPPDTADSGSKNG